VRADELTGSPAVTCSDYRDEMTLLALRRRLNEAGLSKEEKRRIVAEIRQLEKRIGMN
jgi:hypothetical protein